MEVKTVARLAKDYVRQLYEDDENITNVNLEEIEYDIPHDVWKITVGFSRPFESPAKKSAEIMDRFGGGPRLRRSYKVLTITEAGEVRSMKDREAADA